MAHIKDLQKIVHQMAKEKGWWDDVDGKPRDIASQFVNFHAEISEAWEEVRDGKPFNKIIYHESQAHGEGEDTTERILKPCGVPIELADCVIRIMDTCEAYEIDLEEAILEKIKFNQTRPYRHGGKKF